MKIQVFVRSADWLHSAGTRIRYRRLQPEFARLGYSLAIDPISTIREGLKLNADIYLFSKCQDAGALMLADMLREAGALVGFDLFDDYISGDSSITFAQRDFQRSLSGRVDFLLCSTERMSTVARLMDPTIPVHVLNDPFEPATRERLAQLVDHKADQARRTGRIDVLWFGQGNNPLFPVGISDLVAFSEALQPLKTAGLNVHLKVLTNADVLDADGLSHLRDLPYPIEVAEWSAEEERVSLDQAMVAFLPVNYQSFSVAKSLNRAVTALTHGAQILTAGYPLYAALDAFIYSEATELTADLHAKSLKLRTSTLNKLDDHLTSLADPAQEAARFLTFLTALPSGAVEIAIRQRPLRAIVHGAASTPAIHSLGRALGWLSLGSPLTRQMLSFHAQIGFFDGAATTQLRLSREALPRLAGNWQGRTRALPGSGFGEYSHVLPLPETQAGILLSSLTSQMLETRAGRMIHSETVMTATEAVFGDVFGDMLMMRSEMEMPLPGMARISAGRV
jgi:hypothetical protein